MILRISVLRSPSPCRRSSSLGRPQPRPPHLSLKKSPLLARRLTDSYSRANPYGRYTRMSHAALVYSEDGLNPRVEFGVNVFLVQGSSARRYQLLHVTLDALV